MTRAKLDLTGLDVPEPRRDAAMLREISEQHGFVSRQPPVAESTVEAGNFQRPPRPTGNRNIAINVRVPPETANQIYALRDIDPTRKQAIADVIEEAVKLLYERQFPTG